MLKRLFRPNPIRDLGRTLYASAVDQSRQPDLYRTLGAPDTVEGRFEVYSLHVILLLDRFAEAGAPAQAASQALFDTYVSALDNALREMGVGDLSVGRKMRKLAEAFYGRVKSSQAAFAALPDDAPLTDFLKRTVYAGDEDAPASALCAYVTAQRAKLAAQPLAELLQGRVEWNAP